MGIPIQILNEKGIETAMLNVLVYYFAILMGEDGKRVENNVPYALGFCRQAFGEMMATQMQEGTRITLQAALSDKKRTRVTYNFGSMTKKEFRDEFQWIFFHIVGAFMRHREFQRKVRRLLEGDRLKGEEREFLVLSEPLPITIKD